MIAGSVVSGTAVAIAARRSVRRAALRHWCWVEKPHRGGPGALQRLERGPAREEVTGEGRREVGPRHMEREGEVLLERRLQREGDLGALLDEGPPMAHEAVDGARRGLVQPERCQVRAMVDQER